VQYEQTGSVGGYVTIQRASELLGKTYVQTYRWVKKANLPTIKVGTALLVRAEDIQKAGQR
jgi:excisionase family DNA binding protein